MDVIGLPVEFEQTATPPFATGLGNLVKSSQRRGINALSPTLGAYNQVVVKRIDAVGQLGKLGLLAQT